MFFVVLVQFFLLLFDVFVFVCVRVCVYVCLSPRAWAVQRVPSLFSRTRFRPHRFAIGLALPSAGRYNGAPRRSYCHPPPAAAGAPGSNRGVAGRGRAGCSCAPTDEPERVLPISNRPRPGMHAAQGEIGSNGIRKTGKGTASHGYRRPRDLALANALPLFHPLPSPLFFTPSALPNPTPPAPSAAASAPSPRHPTPPPPPPSIPI